MVSAARKATFPAAGGNPSRGAGPVPPDGPGRTALTPQGRHGRVPTGPRDRRHHVTTGLHELDRLSRELGGARSALDDRLGIEYTEAETGRVAARMPVDGNTQAYGTLHGGASCALAEAFFFNDAATTEIYTLSLHDALPRACRRADA